MIPTSVLMHIEKSFKLNGEFSIKQIDYLTRFCFNVKSKSNFIDLVIRLEKRKLLCTNLTLIWLVNCLNLLVKRNKIIIQKIVCFTIAYQSK